MDSPTKVAVLVGSLRKESLTRKLAKSIIGLAPASLSCAIVEIGDLPLYNEDLETDAPAPWRSFRTAVAATQALLFVTPEYNRTIPGGLKNAIDVGSRPYGKSVYEGKAAAVVSVSPGAMGGFGANVGVRNALVFLNVPTMQQPEAYIGGAQALFDEAGEIKVESTRAFLVQFMSSFADWTQLITRKTAN